MDTRLPQRMHAIPPSILLGMASCSTRNASSVARMALGGDHGGRLRQSGGGVGPPGWGGVVAVASVDAGTVIMGLAGDVG